MVVAWASLADALTVLTVGKTGVFRSRRGVPSALVRIGKDPAFTTLADPTCAGGATMSLQVSSYPQATLRVMAQPAATLPCEPWERSADGFVYRDPAGTHGGVRKVVYARSGFLARFEGGGYQALPGPVGYAQLRISIAGAELLSRFHGFRRNDAELVVARKPSVKAAHGEAGFWAVLLGDDSSPARQAVTVAALEKAVKRNKKDGWSHFLLAMLHLYRFGQAVTSYDDVSDAARVDIVAAHEAFQRSVPLLWDGARGDSRVPGFAAAAKFSLGIVQQDARLQAEGLEELRAAVAVNAFFNVFDLIPVVQVLPPSDPRFADVFGLVAEYISDPDTLSCVGTQPEICANAGFAPRNIAGALTLFGDVYAKGSGGDPALIQQAEFFYTIAAAGGQNGYRFADALAQRAGQAAQRAALYLDDDPTNDPFLIGAGPEACAVCHYR